MGTAARHGAKGITLRDARLLPTTPPAMVLQPRLVSHLPPAPKHHPGRGKEGSTCVPSPPGHSESAAGQSQLLGRAHLEAAGVPVVPGTFGLLLLLCGGKAGGKSLHQPPASQRAAESGNAARTPQPPPPVLGHWTPVSPIAPPTQPGQPGAGAGWLHPLPRPRATLGAGDTYPGAAGTSVPAEPGCAAPPGAGAAWWGRRRCRGIPRPPYTARSAASQPRPW